MQNDVLRVSGLNPDLQQQITKFDSSEFDVSFYKKSIQQQISKFDSSEFDVSFLKVFGFGDILARIAENSASNLWKLSEN